MNEINNEDNVKSWKFEVRLLCDVEDSCPYEKSESRMVEEAASL